MLYTLVFIGSLAHVVVPNLPDRPACEAAARAVATIAVPAEAEEDGSRPKHACIETVDPRQRR